MIVPFLSEELCEVNVAAATKQELLAYIAERLATHPVARNCSQQLLLRELKKREQQISTGFGNEVAIPHARVKGMNDFVSFVLTSKEGIPFDAVDNVPVKLFFILVGPEERVNDHIKKVALLSRVLCREQVKEQLLAHTESAELYQQVAEEIKKHTVAEEQEGASMQEATQSAGASGASLLLITVYEEDYLQQILESLLEYGITGATIIDSVGMGQFLSQAPLFGHFIGVMRQNRYHSKTIIAVAENSALIEKLFDEIEQNIGEKRKYEIVSLFAIPLQAMRGSMSAL